VPAETVAGTVMVMVEVPEPGEAIDDGLKLTVAPVGAPLAVSETAELKPLSAAVVMVAVAEFFCTTLSVGTDDAMENDGAASTVRAMAVV